MSSLIRLYPACYKGDIQAINAGPLDVHINLQYKKSGRRQGKHKYIYIAVPTAATAATATMILVIKRCQRIAVRLAGIEGEFTI